MLILWVFHLITLKKNVPALNIWDKDLTAYGKTD